MKKLFATSLLLLLGLGTCLAQNRPNILWITIEDTSPHFIGCYGNQEARTPVIDQLAGEGVRFTNAFSTGTVCSPSRCTLITGVRTFELGTGNHRSNYPIPANLHGFPFYLQKAGYYTTNNSKTDYNVANPKQFTEEAWNESSNKAGWWDRPPGQPFFAVFNFNDSHQSRTMTDTYPQYVEEVLAQLPEGDQIGQNDFKMPPIFKDTPAMRKQFARVYNAIKLTDNNIGELLARLEKDHLRDSTIIFFYADHGEGIPRGKTNGINLGYRVPFVAWFPPMYQHLSPWGKSGIVTDELISFEDLAPTMISLAGGEVPKYLKGRILLGKNRSKPVDHLLLSSDRADNGIDMVRTITDGRYLYSRNYMPYMPEARYIRYMEISDMKNLMRQDLASGSFDALQSSLFDERPAEFLFDTQNDVWETKNLIAEPKYQAMARRMQAQLKTDVLKARDILFLPEYEIAKISQSTTPYEYRLDKVRYPLEKIYQIAALSGKRGRDETSQQAKALTSPNEIIRYWAALGLRSQTQASVQPYQSQVLAAAKDPYLPVGVLASAVAYQQFAHPMAEKNLKALAESENEEIALMAINELLYVSNKDPFVETVRAVHKAANQGKYGKGDAYKVKAACMDFLGSVGLVPNNPDYKD